MVNRIGLNIRALRVRLNLSSRELSAQLNKASNAISSYETGKSSPPTDVIFELAEIFQVSAGAIMTEDLSDPEVLQDVLAGDWSATGGSERKQVLREKALLHGALNEKEAQVAAARAELLAMIASSADDPDKKKELETLLAILEK